MKDIKGNKDRPDTGEHATSDSEEELGALFNSSEANSGNGSHEDSSHTDGNNQDEAIDFDEKFKERLPVDFNIDDIGKIDLKEAEAIANENILFLTEDDLIIGLEDFDLIPLKDSPAPEEKTETAPDEDTKDKKIQIDLTKIPDSEKTPGKIEAVELPPEKSESKKEIIAEDEVTKDQKEEIVSEVQEGELEITKEILPDALLQTGSDNSNVIFIDDESIEKALSGEGIISEEKELSKITANTASIVEGRKRDLRQGSIEDDKKKIPTLLKYTRTDSQDFVLDFEDEEYKYRDNELNFIESAIIEDDYGNYVRKIDDLYGSMEKKHATHVSELFGFSHDDFDAVHEKLYVEEYRDINIDEEIDLFKTDSGSIDLSEAQEKYCTYILPESNSLSNIEKISIEDDLSSTNAMIFEEDVSEIRQLYGKDVDFKPSLDLFEDETEDEPKAEAREQIADTLETAIEQIDDITDKIVIVDDEIDVDRFVKEFPENKQTNLKNLLKYLDGLFEKLPESTIKSFANSEYFDLYVKILNDMGVK